MNATRMQGSYVRDPNKKIKVEFERAPLKVRLKEKYLSLFFAKKVVWYLFRLVLLIGISYVILFPFISKIAGSFMEFQDFVDVSVRLIPKHFTLDTYLVIYEELSYLTAFFNTFVISIGSAIIQTFICCVIGYGFAKFKFKGSKWIFLLVMLTMIIPHPTLQLSMLKSFQSFDINLLTPISTVISFFANLFGTLFNAPWADMNATTEFGLIQLIGIITGNPDLASGINMTNTYFPFIVLSLFGLGFKNGLYIFLLRQFFRGVPDELEESAYIDGTGVFRTFIKIILPLSIPMMITVFLFAFSWQWTDTFYTNLFISPNSGVPLLVHMIEETPPTLLKQINAIQEGAASTYMFSAVRGTIGIMIIMPLVIVYVFCQKFLVQGIERSGLTAD